MPTNKRFRAALAKQEKAIRSAIEGAIAEHAASINMPALIEALERGDVAAAVSIAQIPPSKLYPLDQAISGAYVTGGAMVVQQAPSFAISFGFDGRATRAESWSRVNAAGRVQEISVGQGDMLRTAIGDQLAGGVNPRRAAVNIAGRMNSLTGRREGGVIGLTTGQERTVANVRRDLMDLNPSYFTRSLRDRRFDGLVRKAIKDGKPIAQPDIDRITGRYADRALKWRADNIARSESITALRAGRDEGIMQAIEQGAINGDAAVKVWDATLDKRTRPDHVDMDGQEVPVDEAFLAPDGSLLMYPGDTSLGASAAQTAQCRCFVDYKVDWLRG